MALDQYMLFIYLNMEYLKVNHDFNIFSQSDMHKN